MGRRGKGIDAAYNALSLPNRGSKTATPASLAIDLRYEHLEIHGRWNWERFRRLAAFLNVTHSELGSIVCLSHQQVETFAERNVLPRTQRAACLVLTILEAYCCKAYTNDVIVNPFPNLEQLPAQPESEKEKLNCTLTVGG